MDTDKISAAMGNYMLQGWAMLNDGCPDCNTPLMRNREATSQICVNCQLNPPVDPEETAAVVAPTESQMVSAPLPPPPMAAMPAAPGPSAALPSLPSQQQQQQQRLSQKDNRMSVLDPVMENARKSLRPTGRLGGSGPIPPPTPPPARPTSSFPQPPKGTPPAKSIAGVWPPKANIPLPPGPPPAANGSLAPQTVARDMRRSPSNSMVISENMLPPTTPPPPPPSAMTSGPLPEPPTRPPPSTESVVSSEPDVAPAESLEQPMNPEEVNSQQETITETTEASETVPESAAATEETPATQETMPEPAQTVQPLPTEEEEEEDKGAESDDDFEDAAEEVYRPTEEEIKARELKREQSERASRLIGQKMLQGWAMLQDPCPNPSCHGVPLIRNREKKEFCVVCENYYQREQDLEHGKYTLVREEQSAAPAPAPVSEEETPKPAAVVDAPTPTPISQAALESLAEEILDDNVTSASFPAAPTTLPPPPKVASPPIPPQYQSIASPPIKAASPVSSPSTGKGQRDLHGRISNSIVLPPAVSMSPSLGMAGQQILGKHMSEDLDKLTSEDEEFRKHIQIIRKVGEFSNRSLPPVPGPPLPQPPSGPPPLVHGSRPTSTYSSSSSHHMSENERSDRHHSLRHGPGSTHQQQQTSQQQQSSPNGDGQAQAPPPAPLSPEVQALVSATHKTIATILVKLEAYRLALEVTENPKECQVLTNQIRGLMECLKACRETL